jgi:transposase-like protein
MTAEHGFSPAHTTIMRWVQGFVPEFEVAGTTLPANPADAGGSMRPASRSVASGPLSDLYRAVDRDGKTVEFRQSHRRDVAAA